MLIIKVLHMLDQYTVAVSMLDEREHHKVEGVDQVESIAYTTFPYPPNGDVEDLVTMIRSGLETGQAWIDARSRGDWMLML